MASLPASVALANIADGSPIVAADHRNNYSSVQAALNALIVILAGGTAGQLFGSSGGTTVAWADPPAAAASVPTGSVTAFAAAAAPAGWLLCDGTAVSRTTYAALYAVIATGYGAGDGSTTFNVPDLRGRAPVGEGTHADVSALGNSDGVAVGSRRPKHKHVVGDPGHSHAGLQPGGGSALEGTSGGVVFNTGTATTGVTVGPQTGSEPTDSPAYLVVQFIIKT